MSAPPGGSAPGSRGELWTGSRRQLLTTAAATATVALLAACGKESLHDQLKHDPSVARMDIALFERLLDVERLGIAAYTAGAPILPASPAAACKQFLAQELGHAGTLMGLIRTAGGKPPEPRPSYNLGAPRTTRQVLQLLHQVERAQIAAYLEAIPRLEPGAVRQQVAALYANDAQHVAVVRFLLGEPALPAALVTGAE